MKKIASTLYLKLIIVFFAFALCSFWYNTNNNGTKNIKFPYKQAGLTDKQAAAHLLSRFTYGATQQQINDVVKMGLENWFLSQLQANLPDSLLHKKLEDYDAINFTNAQVLDSFPRQAKIIRIAVDEGYIHKDSIDKGDKKAYNEKLEAVMKIKRWRDEKELFRQFFNQKILRAAYTNNQLQEVLTDFWFNHFNVSITKNDCAQFIPAYERDVIRPNVFGKFENLLLATAKSPAMLLYLDNFTSAGTNENFEKFQPNNQKKKLLKAMKDTTEKGKKILKNLQKRIGGLNENYAREVMELHTLGVDGGYTQTDVTEAARVLTGWTIYPLEDEGPLGNIKKAIERFSEDKLKEKGFIHDGDFLFAINRHDDNEKTVLRKKFEAGGGYNEGVELLHLLATHNATAKFIAKKIATRFVNDNPAQTLIDKMAKTFLSTDGDITQILITMVTAPEFWSKQALREKTKSPFELAISTVRSLNADIQYPIQLNNWITKMGQKIYFYQAPTGYPDKGQYWINTGSLLNRMNFGLAIANKKIRGIKFDLAQLNNNKEPESAEEALKVYSKILLPERNIDATIKRLKPVLNDPEFSQKVDAAANKTNPNKTEDVTSNDMMATANKQAKENKNKNNIKGTEKQMNTVIADKSILNQVVGIILGSPEYQRK